MDYRTDPKDILHLLYEWFKDRSAPDQDETGDLTLLEKRREMLEVESGLVTQKEDFAVKMEALAQRREELARKEASLKESLTKFDKFLKENDAKRARAIKKAFDEKKLREQKDQEIERLQESVEALGKQRERQIKAVENNQIFQQYLESILETTDEFGEIKDIIARYDTLSATNLELLERARMAQERNEKLRLEFAKATESKNTVILNYNNQLARLQKKLEDSQGRTAALQNSLDDHSRTAKQKSLLIGQVKISNATRNLRATNNLFALVRAHLQNRTPASTDTFDQLDKIAQFIADLQVVIEVLTKQKDRGTIMSAGDAVDGETIRTEGLLGGTGAGANASESIA
ncbi:Cilia- and flagella-associated protein 73 [Gonapodya sp. JEL0774]|nr:Cilia- and flagella-associated protein 73 [Gonapodya sp. JEL0774]